MDTPDRLQSLDAVRGVAALSVVLCHWHYLVQDGLPGLPPVPPSALPLHPLLFLFYDQGELGVDLFFVLSGFVFFWLYAEPVAQGLPARQFAWRRLARLYPLHATTLGLVAVLQAFHVLREGAPWGIGNNDALHFLLHLALAQAWWPGDEASFNAPAWSLSVEILLYAAFFVLCRFRLRSPAVLLLIVLAGAPTLAEPHARGVTGFFVGGLTWTLHAWILARPAPARIAAGLRVAAALAWVLAIAAAMDPARSLDAAAAWIPGGWGQRKAVATLFPLTVLALTVGESCHGSRLGRLAWLGDASYAIYLLHLPLMLAATLLLPGHAWASSVAGLATFVAATVGLSVVTHRAYERPMQRWMLSRVDAREPAPSVADAGPRAN